MIINIDTNNITDLDRVLLSVLTGQAGVVAVPAAAAAPAAEEKAAAPKAAAETKAAETKAAEPVAEPEPEAAAATEEPAAADGPTVAQAVEVAMALVAEGRAADVKAIVATLSAEKVSLLEGEEIQTFLDAVAALPPKSDDI